VTERLSPALLAKLDGSIGRPRYDREKLADGVVHLGLGAFHRAHQAAYLDEMAARGDMRWGVVGVSLRSPAVRDTLAPQGGLYTLVERDAAGERTRIMAPLRRVLVAPEAPGAVVEAMARPSVRVVTLTVTEKGYCLARDRGGLDVDDPAVTADLASLGKPRTAVGLLVAALNARRDTGLPPFTAISCDNLPGNGVLLRDAVLALAAAHDAGLAEWIATYGAFPSSMVDRIVPATTPEAIADHAARFGYRDEALVETERFCQWVLEDSFVGERPDFAAAGVTLTQDVAPWEEAKLRLLNGAHSTIAYLGGLGGIDHVHEFVARADRRALVERLWDESAATLTPPREMDPSAYRAALMARFANPALRHRTHQIAMDGSQKLPQRLVAPWRERLESGLPSPVTELAIAAWMAWQRGADMHDRSFAVDDPLAETTAMAWAMSPDAATAAARLLGLREVFGDLAERWPDAVGRVARRLRQVLEARSLDDLLPSALGAEAVL
jgi:fructuronate reductase